jgi:hypothetical protein
MQVCWRSSWRSLICQGKHLSLSFDAQSEHLCSHTSHMLEVSVTDPDNPDYPGIPDGASRAHRI